MIALSVSEIEGWSPERYEEGAEGVEGLVLEYSSTWIRTPVCNIAIAWCIWSLLNYLQLVDRSESCRALLQEEGGQ